MAGDDEQPPLPPPKREMNSPFFLGTGDRPGDFITPTRLRGDNYDDWASDIQLALEARRKFEFLEGTITGPQPPYTQSDWNTVNAMLVSWITNTIDPEVKSTLSKFRDAKRLWEHLKQRYAMVNGPRIQQLKTSIAKCEQSKSMSVTTYYGKLNVLWEELFKHEPLISCTCCSSCTAASLHQARREQGKLHDFLMGLNTDLYAQLRTNILSQDPLPSLDRAYQLVIQDERVRLAKAVTEDKPAEVLGFAVRTGAGRGRGKTERPVCSHCKKTGHETSTCWPSLLVLTADGGAGRSRQQAGRGRGSARANAASSTIGASSTKSSTDQLFTPEQWKALAGLIGNAQVPDDRLTGKFDTKSWIIDTGATHHVTGDLSWLFDTIALFECPVGLPNGESVVATQSGSDHTRELIGTGVRRDGLYYFGGAEGDSVQHVSVHNAASTLELWHKRMGHPSEKVVKLLPPVSNLKGSLNKACEICFRAKHPRDKFPLSDNKATRIFEKIHCDLWGSYKHVSSCGARYFLTIVDDFSRAVWIYLLVDKTEVFRMFMSFIAMVDRQFSQTVKVVQSDNGTEFKCLLDYFSATGILFQTSCVGTPQQNGRVERKHKHILNVGRALRFQANLPIYFWGESVLAAAHLINRTPSPLLHNKTPFEILFGTPPSYAAIHTFGCLSFAHDQKSKGDKFASRSRKCVFLGYPFGKKGWKLFDLDTKKLFVSRDVKFFEDVFPFGNPGAVNIIPDNIVPTVNVEIDSDFADFVDDDADLPNPQAQTQNPNLIQPEPQAHQDLSPGPEVVPTVGLDNTSNGQSAPMGKGMRDKFPSVLLRDFVTHTVVAESPSPATPSPQHPSAIISSNDPKSFKEAMKDVGWQKSMHEEIQALEENGTWTLEPLPKGKRALGSQWVYRTKYFSNGDIERLKSRLVVLGNHQEAGIDYHETFSPVAKMTTVRAFLAIAASKNWELHQMDVHNAFLHGDLEEEVYMKLPPGFESSDPNLVCRLRKSLYGLKQAPRCWFAKLVTALKGYGFLQSYSDYSLFTYTKGNVQINVLVYVDDLIISGNDSAALKTFKAYLSDCFKMKDLGVLKYFLRIEVARSSAGLFLCQRKYTLDIVSEAGLLGAKPCGFPIEQNHRLGLAKGELLSNPESYRRLVGRLIYLAVTRPDLAYSVHILSQFMQDPRIEHWEAALRVVRYLKGTPGQGILLRADSDLSLQGWCDSDWAACPVTRRSLSGWLVFLGQSPISWKTKKQHTVSRSSAEAEYRAMAAVTCELKWLKGLLLSLGVHHPKAIKLFCDSQSALHMAKNPVFHERTKHIEVDCHFVRDAITDGLIAPSYVPTVTQLADIFTKALGKKQFDYLLAKLGIFEPHAPT
ncbi:Retrovirus-related Pol polyprotein from transposon TNT 1-94 [Vitis vinifera]|uniref:Retrovirus-related Pol polyprotein from transposon TNT 1-94 n=1 Tax=Vitis vinifera TaxID=29760 RepID=A0A438EGZ1_VITVI|nr:Retrovirus-related Pol polyprotein from transposon TNT 1-94 [Vitis vinifera]